MVVLPFALEQDAGIEIDDIGFEAEAEVRFDARALELMVAREREHIVPDHVRFAVMLVKASVRRAINYVAFSQNPTASFIEIDSPAAITRCRNVMPKVVDDSGAGLLAQRIDAAHVA